jgi:TatD DNase family protein
VLHCYSEDSDYARRALELDMNLFFSFAGNLTYRNARNLHETVRVVPLERILIESEAPFMVPADFRGKRNKPEYLPATALFLSEILEMDVEEVAKAVYENACRFFRIPAPVWA